ncbi:MAG: DEAD/DEAH box helicase, partial [Lachnospiraceae bacterium]|nr:DEAD/DEAH box helicase [Lachnospiraceae bacterium]
YEEFLILKSFIVQQYKKIYILNNNLYINQYPVEIGFSDEVRQGMLNHFTDSELDDDDSEIGDIDEIISIYTGMKEYHTYLIGSYCDDDQTDDMKIHRLNLFDDVTMNLETVSQSAIDDFIDVIEESDYIEVVKSVLDEPDRLNIRITNYVGDSEQLKRHISILASIWSDHTRIYYVQVEKKESTFEHRDAYRDILKKHWGKDSFRKFIVYDIAKLDEGIKDTYEVSQEQIISDIVQQVENCQENGKSYRDIFVTAPTGAGKSAMFQIPAIYIAEQYKLLTIVISPLIGLMNDQVKNLEVKNYNQAKTINSDISPLIKEEIISKVQEGEYNILYISPETLLSRSDVEQLIGDRTIGMIVIDEAHIVTTWGKQFRPDYWYLGDHIRTLRRNQTKRKGKAFLIATFTATAIYHGIEDMYEETRNGLHMLDPITYLGYMKRSDITIEVKAVKKGKNVKTEYETDKYDHIIKKALITNKKTLVYFPTVALIERCYEYLNAKGMGTYITKYHGSLSKDEKTESYERFMSGEKKIMLATKAFGMGIDIEDIETVVHFAPTGNVCDYVQEIGRAARKPGLTGEACYEYDTRDFKHINRLHGLSTIQKYQIVEVIKKIEELYRMSLQRNGAVGNTKKRNAMLVDAENFTYIFQNSLSSEDTNINKVKTALLIVQKDFENKIGFSPITVRPIPMFAMGFFSIESGTQARLSQKYKGCVEQINEENHICRVRLDKIWNKDYLEYSFPQFKYLIYTNNSELEFHSKYTMKPALCVSVDFADEYRARFQAIWSCLRKKAQESIVESRFVKFNEMVSELVEQIKGISKYKAQTICEVFLSSIDSYRRNFLKMNASIMRVRQIQNGETEYQFNVAISTYFNWVENGLRHIAMETKGGELYIVNTGGNDTKRYSIILGILEAMDILSFSMIGGANSQLYIYISQIRPLQNIINNPKNYRNRLLDMVAERHLISVKMMTYLFGNEFHNAEIWDVLEDYFVGKIPDKVKMACLQENPNIDFNNAL